MNAELETLLDKAKARLDAMTPEQHEAMLEAQRQSWARAFAPAGTDMTRDQIEARIKTVEESIAAATCWGAALSKLGEERDELRALHRTSK